MNKEYLTYENKILGQEIERLAKEVEKLEKVNKMLLNSMVTEAHTKETKEIERLNNIINELEKWLKGEIDYNDNWYNPETKEYIGQKHFPDDTVEGFQYALDKLQELKGSDKK